MPFALFVSFADGKRERGWMPSDESEKSVVGGKIHARVLSAFHCCGENPTHI